MNQPMDRWAQSVAALAAVVVLSIGLPLPCFAQAAAAITTTESVSNPYGLQALWAQGDLVARGTLAVLVIMSMGSWYVIVTKFLEQRAMLTGASGAADRFWRAGSVQAGIDALADGTAFKYIASEGHRATNPQESPLIGSVDPQTWIALSMDRAVGSVQSRLQGGMAVLATVGSTAPFVGLFGTVWGIYNALVRIGISGQASIDKVAGPVGEALIMTAIGLAVAVPAVMGYNWLLRRNRQVMEQTRAFAGELRCVLLAGRR